jgi:YHS domain-containing protein
MIVLLLAVMATAGIGAMEPVNKDGVGTAVGGYDPVAYFLDGKAVVGDSRISLELNGAIYNFASTANKSLFEADPDAYLPSYGGYCAWAVGQGYSADIDPEAWTIHEGRLFLNYNKSIRRRFQNNIDASIAAADNNWPAVKSDL